MEAVLGVSTRPYDPRFPQVCFDEVSTEPKLYEFISRSKENIGRQPKVLRKAQNVVLSEFTLAVEYL